MAIFQFCKMAAAAILDFESEGKLGLYQSFECCKAGEV